MTNGPALRARRVEQAGGLSRRTLLRAALGTGLGLWAVEVLGGTVAFAWSAVAGATPKVVVGTLDDLVAINPNLPIREGFPVYVAAARAFVILVDPARPGWEPGADPTGDGAVLNVRALSQRCPHLGCRPNPCIEDFWFHCPCHQSRYDRLGIKADGEPLRSGAARHGPLRDQRGRRRRPDHRHRTGHPGAPAGRARAARVDPATRRARVRVRPTVLIRLYPGAWRRRYGDEMSAVLDAGPIGPRDIVDLAARRARRMAPPGDAVAHPGGRRPSSAAASGRSARPPSSSSRRRRTGRATSPRSWSWPSWRPPASWWRPSAVRFGRATSAAAGWASRSTIAMVGYLAWLAALAAVRVRHRRRPDAGGRPGRRDDRQRMPSGCCSSGHGTTRSALVIAGRVERDAHPVDRELAGVRRRVDGDRHRAGHRARDSGRRRDAPEAPG